MPKKLSKLPMPVDKFVENNEIVQNEINTFSKDFNSVNIDIPINDVKDDALEYEICKVKYIKLYDLLNASKYNIDTFNPVWNVKTINEKINKMKQITTVQSQFETNNILLHTFKTGVFVLEKFLSKFVRCDGLANDLLSNPDILREIQILSIERVGIPTFIGTEYRILSIFAMAIGGCIMKNKMTNSIMPPKKNDEEVKKNDEDVKDDIRQKIERLRQEKASAPTTNEAQSKE
jgi:hypothetical protein